VSNHIIFSQMEPPVYYMFSLIPPRFPLMHHLARILAHGKSSWWGFPSFHWTSALESTILGFMTIVVQGFLSVHLLEKLGKFLLQHLQQQQ